MLWTGEYVWSHTPWSHEVVQGSPGWNPNSNQNHVFSGPIAPAGKVFKPRTISVSTKYGGAVNYMIEHLVNVEGGHHYHCIARTPQPVAGTPVLYVPPADCAAMILLPGEQLAARSVGSSAQQMMLLWSGWLFPEAALPELQHWGFPVVTTSEGPDLTALVDASMTASLKLEEARAALTALAQSVP